MNEKNNNKDIMSLLEDKYILEAEPAGTARKKNRPFKLSVAAAVVAACVGLTAVTAGAFIYKNTRSSTEEFYDSRAEEILDSKGLIRTERMSNEHFDVKLDAVLADDLVYRIFFTAEPKDDAAMEYVKKIRNNEDSLLVDCEDSSGGYYGGYSHLSYVPEDSNSISIVMDDHFDKRFRDTFADGNLYLNFSMQSMREDSKNDLFKDIGFTVKVEKNLKAHVVKLENGVSLYVSPIEYAYIGSDPDLVQRSGGGLSFIWKDGGRERFLESIGITSEKDAAYLAEDKWAEYGYLIFGKFYNGEMYSGSGMGGIGGHGMGFYIDGDVWINNTGDIKGVGDYAMTSFFGCVIDFDDVSGINCGFESYMFDE